MLLIPAIDLKQGHCVRLEQGDMDKVTTFSEDPGAMAKHWVEQGARRLHLVDLDGAFAGKPKNESAIKSILKAVGDDIPVQLGGGIRDLETIERLLDDGISYVIIGTAAVKNPGFLQDACVAFPGHIIVGLDALLYSSTTISIYVPTVNLSPSYFSNNHNIYSCCIIGLIKGVCGSL